MKRVMIIGCCGAGKSTLARALHRLTGLELVHLDQCYWNAGWQEPETDEWTKVVQEVSDKSSWIIDGNYGGTMDVRIRKADTIIFLDYPTWTCLYRVVRRVMKYWRRERPDMPMGCKERFDLEFFHYVATFKSRRRKKILDSLSDAARDTNVIVLKNDRAVEQFLGRL